MLWTMCHIFRSILNQFKHALVNSEKISVTYVYATFGCGKKRPRLIYVTVGGERVKYLLKKNY